MKKESSPRQDTEYYKKAEQVIKAIDSVYPSYRDLMIRSFIQGVFVALGTTIGFSILIAIITFVLAQLQVIPSFKYIINQTQIQNVLPKKD